MKSHSKASKRHRGVVVAGLGAGVTAVVLVVSGSAGAACLDAVTVQNYSANLNTAANASGSDALYLAQTAASTLPQPHEEEDAQHQQDLKDQQHMLDEQDQHMKLQHTSGQDDEEQHQIQQPAPTQ